MLGLPPPPFQPTHLLSHHHPVLATSIIKAECTSGLADGLQESGQVTRVWWPLLVGHTPPLHKPGQALVQESLIPTQGNHRASGTGQDSSVCVCAGGGGAPVLDKAPSRNVSAFQKRESLCLPSSAHLRESRPARPTPDLLKPSSTFTCSTQLCFLPLLLFRLLQPHFSLSLPSALPPGGPTHQPHPWAPAPASAEVQPPQEGVDCAGPPGRAQQRRTTLRPGWLFRELPATAQRLETHPSSEPPHHSGLCQRWQARASSSEFGACKENHRKAETGHIPRLTSPGQHDCLALGSAELVTFPGWGHCLGTTFSSSLACPSPCLNDYI